MDETLRDIIQNIYHRIIPDDVEILERNGYIFFLHSTKRFDPMTLAMTGMVAGTTMGVMGTLEEGKQAEKIAQQRATIDIQNAEAARRASVEEAKIKKERGIRFLEGQKATAAARGIRLNVGVPLVIEAQTRADIAKDIGFTLERGREGERFYRSRAAIETAVGKAKRKRSKWDAISRGLSGFGSIAMMGTRTGLEKRIAALESSK